MAKLSTEDGERSDSGALVPVEEPLRDPPRERLRAPASAGRAMRLVLPLAALLLVGGVFVFASRTVVDAPKGLTIDGVVIGEGLEVTNPRFVGETDDGSDFKLTAERAKPDGPDPEKIKLVTVAGDVALPGGRKLNATAADGLFKPKKQELELHGDVVARTSDGYTLSSETMRFDLATRIGRTEAPVRIEGPMGSLTAETMEARFENDFEATFSGGVKITITRLVGPKDP